MEATIQLEDDGTHLEIKADIEEKNAPKSRRS